MKFRRFALCVALALGAQCFLGCTARETEAKRAEKARARLELEEKARREAAAANQAITDLNRRMFGKAPAEPPPAPPKK